LRICGNAFEGCIGLLEVEIPNSVTYIGERAFSGCKNLKKITILQNVTEISHGAFDGCDNLIIYCHSNSYAEKYAIIKGISYVLIDK
jgi:hypothetical protein